MKQVLIQGVPDNLHGNFKAACAKKNVSMKETLIAFMKRFGKNERRRRKRIEYHYDEL